MNTLTYKVSSRFNFHRAAAYLNPRIKRSRGSGVFFNGASLAATAVMRVVRQKMMAPYFLAFLDELKARGYDVSEWSHHEGDKSTLTLAAKNPLVGPLVLVDDNEELTLEVGTKYHCHFDGQEIDEYGADRMHAAAMLAADYVDRILRERIGVAVHYNERRCIGAALIYLDEHALTPENLKNTNVGTYGGLIRTERFLWSGPVGDST